MRKLMTICTIATMILTVSGLTQAALLHNEGFETNTGDWTDYDSVVTRVASGTGGITSAGGSYHAVISDPDPLPAEYGSGAYSWTGDVRTNFGDGWSSSMDIYIDLTDGRIADGTYFFDLSQAISNNTGTGGLQDNIFHVGAANIVSPTDKNEDGSYELYVSASHNSGTGQLLSPGGYGGDYTIGQFTESGWYTFSYDFTASTERADSVQVTWDVTDASNNSLWNVSWTTEHYALSDAGANYYLWFVSADTDDLAIDNVQVNGIPEPGTLALLGLGSLLLRKRK